MSTREVAALVDSYAAGEALTSKRYFAMTLSSGDAVGVSTAGGAGIGVALDKPPSGGEVAVGSSGVFPISYGGTITALDPLTVDSSGEFVKSLADDDYYYGMALESGVDGDQRSAMLSPPFQRVPLLSADGRGQVHLARATYDFAVDGGAISSIGLGVSLPDNAVVIRAFYVVYTTLTSATDAATIALTIPTDDVAGIVAATAISAGGNVWDAGWHEAIQDGAAANFSEPCTAARELTATIAVEALTAGKFTLCCEYVIID